MLSIKSSIKTILILSFAVALCWCRVSTAEARKLVQEFAVPPVQPTLNNASSQISSKSFVEKRLRFAQAGVSTINPAIPVPNSALNSAPIRGNFIAAENDVNALYGLLTGIYTGQMLQSTANGAPVFSASLWPATTTQYQLLYSSAKNTVAELATAASGVLVTNGSGAPSISVTLPNGLSIGNATITGTVTAPTNSFAGDVSTQLATDAFVQASNLLQMSTVPMAITGGTYSFATTSTNFPVINHVANGSGVITGATVFSGGSGFAVGDLLIPNAGNHDALLIVTAVSGTSVQTLGVVYGGTGYITQSGITSAAATVIPYTYLLSGALSSNVTIIVTSGTYLNASQQWYFANNTTNAYTVTVCVSNGSDACSAGRTAVIPQGTNNSRIVGVQTDGELNVDIASIVNAADLTGTTLASGITTSSLTAIGTITSGIWHGTVLSPAYGGSTNFSPSAASGGTANAQTFASGNPSSWTLGASNTVCGVLGFTNTGATTLAVNGTTATAVNRRSTSGLTALAGGELISNQAACFLYDGSVYEIITAIPGAVKVQTGSYLATALDGNGDINNFTGASSTLTLPLSTTLPTNWRIYAFAEGGPLTITANASDAINGGSSGGSVTISKGILATITTNSSNAVYVSGYNIGTLTAADQVLSGGTNLTAYSIGTESTGTYTVDCGKNPVQYLLNGGAFTLASPANDGNCLVEVVNGPSAGTVTLSGFSTSPTGSGDTFATSSTTSSTVTISNASPAVITWSQSFVAGQQVYFTTTGGLPTGISANTIYYVISTGLSGSSFEISATPGGAAINTSSVGTGTQTGVEPSIYTLNVFRVNGLANSIWKQVQ